MQNITNEQYCVPQKVCNMTVRIYLSLIILGTWITFARKMAIVLWMSRVGINVNPVDLRNVSKST